MDSRDLIRDGEEDGLVAATYGLGREVFALFQSRRMKECIEVLNQLLQMKKNDQKVVKMGERSFFDRMISHVRSTSKYYTGYPKDLGPSRVLDFTSEREFVHLLHQGYPVAVAFTIKCNYSKHVDEVLEEAAAEFYPNVKFVRVECPKYPSFCISRQRKDYPFIEIFHSPEHAANQGRVGDPNITKYSVKVLLFNYDVSTYGFREFFKQHGIHSSDPK